MSAGAEARRFLRRRHHGVLSTLSRRFDGYPFGSIAAFVLDHSARPVMLLSRLAEHYRNLEADPRASLLVQEPGPDVQATARLTLLGDASPGTEMPRARYLKYLPEAEKLLGLGDFSFWTITPRAVRFIGGFGDIRWITPESYAPPAHVLADEESGIITHMNFEHAHNLRDYCRYYHRVDAGAAVMAGIDCDGFDVRIDGEVADDANPGASRRPPNPGDQGGGDAASVASPPSRSHPQPEVGAPAPRSGVLLRFDFEEPVTDAASARAALVAMAHKARGA